MGPFGNPPQIELLYKVTSDGFVLHSLQFSKSHCYISYTICVLAMALTLNINVIVSLFMILSSWASLAMSRTLHEAAMDEKHEQWMVRHGRTYKDQAEKEMRFKIFKQNLEFIQNFNKAGNRSYNLSINQFADLTDEEFLASRTGYKPMPAQSRTSSTSFTYQSLTEVPSSLDWRENGAVTEVKDQGNCGK